MSKTVKNILTTLLVIGAVAKCVGYVADAYHKVNPPKIPQKQARGTQMPLPSRNGRA